MHMISVHGPHKNTFATPTSFKCVNVSFHLQSYHYPHVETSKTLHIFAPSRRLAVSPDVGMTL
jgi:hypothetical protein